MLALEKLDWMQVSALVGIIGLLLVFARWLGMKLLSESFASRDDQVAMTARIVCLEDKVDLCATRVQLDDLEGRVAPVETGVAVLREQVQAVKESALRTEHMVGILLEHELGRERAA